MRSLGQLCQETFSRNSSKGQAAWSRDGRRLVTLSHPIGQRGSNVVCKMFLKVAPRSPRGNVSPRACKTRRQNAETNQHTREEFLPDNMFPRVSTVRRSFPIHCWMKACPHRVGLFDHTSPRSHAGLCGLVMVGAGGSITAVTMGFFVCTTLCCPPHNPASNPTTTC